MNVADKFKKVNKGFDLNQAMAEADRCLLCHDPPCSKGCPADTDPGTFIRKLHLKNITGAIRTVKENNILGGACGILCPTDQLCEKECSALLKSKQAPEGNDCPIQIGKIQRFLIEHAWERGFKAIEPTELKKEKVAVVGSGPAGLSCAAELARVGYLVTVFESRPEPGGVLRYGVVSFRFDLDFLKHELGDIQALGVKFSCNTRIEGKQAAERLLKEGYSAVFLAPGLWGAASLKPNQQKIDGTYTSVEYLSALRDGSLGKMKSSIQEKTVAIIGGGSVAMDCARSAVRLEAEDVYLVYRRSYAQMPAEKDERIDALEDGIHFLLLNQPVDYIVDSSRQISGMKLLRTRLGEPDMSGRRRPITIDGSEWTLKVDAVIEAIGNKPEEDSLEWYPHVKTTGGHLIKSDPETGATSVKGVYAGGDIVRGPSLVVIAVQDGKVAARAIENYLRE